MAATLEQIGEALRRADAAGNVDDARRLAEAYKAMQGGMAVPKPAADAPPAGAKPGSREYAQWAIQQTTQGKRVPQVSQQPPEYTPPEMSLGDKVQDNIAAGYSKAVESVPFVGQHLIKAVNQGRASATGQAYEEAEAETKATQDRNPVASFAGEIIGPTIALAPLGMTTWGARALGLTGPLWARAGMGGLSSAAIFGGDAASRGDEDWVGKGAGAAIGGALFPLGEKVVRSFVGKALRRGTSPATEQVARGLKREGVDTPAALRTKLNDLGPDGMIADIGPNLTRQASTIAALPGKGQAIIRGRLSGRAAGANQRIRNSLDNELGPSPIPSMEKGRIKAAQEALSPNYEAILQQGRPVDVAPIAQNVAYNITKLRGDPQKALQRILPMLNEHGTQNLTRDPRVLFEVRKAIDGMFEGDITSHTRQVLTAIRQKVDAELAAKVPYLKRLDAQFEQLAKEGEALDRGGQVLGSGPETPWPTDLAFEHGMAPPNIQMQLRNGARATLERIVGTNANDVQALNRLIKGEGDWNRDRLATLFGQDKADAIIKVVENELKYAKTNGIVQAGPETAARLQGGKELGDRSVEIPASANWTGIALAGGGRLISALLNRDRDKLAAGIAEIITANGGRMPPKLEAELIRALGPEVKGLIGQGAAGATGERTKGPIEITINGGKRALGM